MTSSTPSLNDNIVDVELYAALEESCWDAELDHPLVRRTLNGSLDVVVSNAQYLYKLEQIYEAIKSQDWSMFVELHEKPHRLQALTRIIDNAVNPKDRWSLISQVWCGSENICQNHAKWKKLWNTDTPDKLWAMDRKEQRAFAALPGQLTIYRGVGKPRKTETGMAWTLDVDKAIWFAARFGNASDALVFTAQANKSDVHALLLRRGEQEIIVNKLKIMKKTALSAM